jgi:hypothetical protein
MSASAIMYCAPGSLEYCCPPIRPATQSVRANQELAQFSLDNSEHRSLL